MAGALVQAAESGSVPRHEVEEFLEEQAAMHARGEFFQMSFFVLVSGTA